MKKNFVIGALLISTIVSAAAPAMAGPLDRAICNLEIIIKNDPRCRDRRPDYRDDRRNDRRPAPRPGFDSTVVRNISEYGEWVPLNLDRPMPLSSLDVRSFDRDPRSEVRARSARVYTTYGRSYDVRAVRNNIDLRNLGPVSSISVFVEARRYSTDAKFTVYSDHGQPSVYVPR